MSESIPPSSPWRCDRQPFYHLGEISMQVGTDYLPVLHRNVVIDLSDGVNFHLDLVQDKLIGSRFADFSDGLTSFMAEDA